MIQRVFYGSLGLRPEEVTGWDLKPREHLELWPLAALFLIMGIFSPFWTRAIDTFATMTTGATVQVAPGWYRNTATGDYSVNNAELGKFCADHPGHCRMRVVTSLQEAR
jgi:NADH-quinone oxidoreductase subunit M